MQNTKIQNISSNKTNKEEKKELKKLPIIEVQEALLATYDIRFNEVLYQVEARRKDDPGANFQILNENSLYIFLLEKGQHITLGTLGALLYSDFVERYNPLIEYFENLPVWDQKTDWIDMLSNHVNAEDQREFNHHFKKMLVRSVACAIDDAVWNKHAFILVSASQGTGKSSFCRYLCPNSLKDYFTETLALDKDGLISLTQHFLINLDELFSLSRFELNHLKTLFSKDRVRVRHPFERKSQTDPRRCSFLGSTNEDQFLTDSSGSVRWLCFTIHDINKSDDGGPNYRDVPIDQVWSQAFDLYKKGFKFQLTAQEIRENERRNDRYQVLTMEQEVIVAYLEPGTDNDEFKTASEIIQILREKTGFQFDFKIDRIGKALKTLGFIRANRWNDILKQPRYGYFVKF